MNSAGVRTLLRALVAAAAWASCTSSPVLADRLSPQRKLEILRESLAAFEDAVAIAHTSPKNAEMLFRTAAGGFSALIDAGVRNAAIEYNLANTHFRLNDLGRAVLHYRRGLRLKPGDAALTANLEYAANRVEPFIAPQTSNRLLRQVLFLHYDTSVSARFWFATILGVMGWGLLACRLRWRATWLAGVGVPSALIALTVYASVFLQIREDARRPAAVVVAQATLRLGRGEGYDAAFREPLGPGVELRILQERGDWAEVRLMNGQTGWLPRGALEKV